MSMTASPMRLASIIVRDDGPGSPLVLKFSNDGAVTEVAWMAPPDDDAPQTEESLREHFIWFAQSVANYHDIPVVMETAV